MSDYYLNEELEETNEPFDPWGPNEGPRDPFEEDLEQNFYDELDPPQQGQHEQKLEKQSFETPETRNNPFVNTDIQEKQPEPPKSKPNQQIEPQKTDTPLKEVKEEKTESKTSQKTDTEKKQSPKNLLAELVNEQELYMNQDKIPFASIFTAYGHKEIEISSSYYEEHLLLQYFKKYETTIPDVKNAVKLSRALAITNEKIIPVHTRFHFTGEELFLDLCDGYNNIVVANRNGWKVTKNHKIKFYEPDYLEKLPEPDENGAIVDLLDFLDFKNPLDKVLVAVWIVTALATNIDRPILLLTGSQGSGKTLAADIIRSIIDPVNMTGMSLPKTERDFAVHLRRHQVPSFDNLTSISGTIQDLMCRIVTGGSIEGRRLYTDNDSFSINFKRAMILTGINNPITQDDLLDRILSVKLNRFSDTERKCRIDIWKKFEKKQAAILGGVLDAFVGALNLLDNLKLKELPRLADFYRFGVAVSEYLGESQGFGKEMFDKAIKNSMRQNYKQDIDENPLVFALVYLLNDQQLDPLRRNVTFTVQELFEKLQEYSAAIGIDPKELPGSSSALSRRLKKIQHELRHQGWNMEFSQDKRIAREVSFKMHYGF